MLPPSLELFSKRWHFSTAVKNCEGNFIGDILLDCKFSDKFVDMAVGNVVKCFRVVQVGCRDVPGRDPYKFLLFVEKWTSRLTLET